MLHPYHVFIKARFDRFKCKHMSDPWISIPVRTPELIGWLKPIVKEWRTVTPELATLLTRWRAENPELGTGKFTPTVERTSHWLDHQIIERDDRLLFLLTDRNNKPIGHLGFSNFTYASEMGEIDSVLRGVKDGYPGIMSYATQALIDWGYRELKLKAITLSVYSDNESAIRFYERLHFVKTVQKPLMKVTVGEGDAREEKLELAPPNYTGPIEKYYLYMNYQGPHP